MFGGPSLVRIDALSRLAQRDRVGDLPRDVRLWVWREVDEFPDRCSWVAFSYVHRHLVEAFGVGVDGADNLRASDAVDPVAHATEVAVDNALAVTHWREADGHLLERVRLQSMHEHPRQGVRGAKMRTSVTAPSLWVVLDKVRNPVEAVHHASKQSRKRKTAPSFCSISRGTFVARFCSRPGMSGSRRGGGHQRTTQSQLQQVRMAVCRAIGNRTGRAARRLWEWRHQWRRRLSPRPALQKCSECISTRSRRPTPHGSHGTSSLPLRAA